MKHLLLYVVLLSSASILSRAEPLNVLFLLSDDQRPDTIAALGNPEIKTPHLDKLAQSGVAFTNAYCMGSMSGAVCAPSRAMILTGRSLYRIPLSYAVPWDKSLPTEEQGAVSHLTMPEHFRAAGYATFCTGKWHQEAPTLVRGFTHGGNIFMGGMGSHTEMKLWDHDPAGKSYGKTDYKTVEGFSSSLFADATIDFLENRPRNKPFFAYVPFTAPHDPRTPPKEYRDLYDASKLSLPENYLTHHPFDNGELRVRDEALAPWPRTPEIVREHLADYYGMITQMDAQIGRILFALETTGAAKNTLIVFASDHGLAIGSHGLMGKQNLYEHSMKAPLIVSGPGLPENEKRDAMLYLHDLFPTLCELANLDIPETVEGKSLAPVLKDASAPSQRKRIFTAYRDRQRAVRTDRWKLIRYPKINRSQLFDLQNDPHELTDLSANPEYAERLESMMAILQSEQSAANDTAALSVDSPAPAEYDPLSLNREKAKK